MRAKRNIVQKIEDSDIKAAIVRVINRFNEEDANTYLTLMKATLCGALKLNGAKTVGKLRLYSRAGMWWRNRCKNKHTDLRNIRNHRPTA